MENQLSQRASREDWEADIATYLAYLKNNDLTPIQQAAVELLIQEASIRIATDFPENLN